MIRLKRAYEEHAPADGYRILVDRLWPRGLSKEKASIDLWLKDIAPSGGLRKWFGHDPEKWAEFRKRYLKELAAKEELLEIIREKSNKGKVTLVFGAADVEHNNAVVLKEHLEKAG
jgi:uncharacterized protein YeaO (DUF488 family)